MHPQVQHPRELLADEQQGLVARINGVVGQVAGSTLGSMALFWVTFLIPLVTLAASDTVKLAVSVIFSSWFQAWALPVLQRGSNQADLKRDAKADTDHQALLHLATTADHTELLVVELSRRLGLDPVTGQDRRP